MPIEGSTQDLLALLPDVVGADIGLFDVDAHGAVTASHGMVERIECVVSSNGISVQLPPGREAVCRRVVAGEDWVVVTFPAERAGFHRPFFESLFTILAEKEQVELDMESMYSSSLALLEEVSMVGEMLPALPLGETDDDVAAIGLSALLVAASVDRVVYLRLDQMRDLAEVAVQVCAGAEDLSPQLVPYAGNPFVAAGDCLVWRAMRSKGGAILESVPAGGHLGADDSPESLARRQVIAVPVRYGAVDKTVTLGVILMMDKRANAYSTTLELGSQETKLASSVASMLGSVLGTRKVAELGNEMRMAQALQQTILPKAAPHVPGFDVAGQCTTSGAVGGDYYDFLRLPDGRLMAVVADVSGHNLASGMMMVSARTSLQLLAKTSTDPGVVFDALAAALFDDLTQTERFITAAAVTLEGGQSGVQLVNAGHNPTMIYRAATGRVDEIFGTDTVLGFLPSPRHDVAGSTLHPGDVLLLYTDGVTEAADQNGEMFEEERLREVLSRNAGGTAEQILAAVFEAVSRFADKTEKGDDISAVVIKAVDTGHG